MAAQDDPGSLSLVEADMLANSFFWKYREGETVILRPVHILGQVANAASNYLRMERIPHVWCPGCGIGTVVKCYASALENSGLDLDKCAIVSGIGCTGRVAGYVKVDSFHTTHGRAIAFATGLKMARPDKRVLVVSGDGDATAIGGNHFIHACRRNIDITMVVFNNSIYGMTGGQMAPTTLIGQRSTTSPLVVVMSPVCTVTASAPRLTRSWASIGSDRSMPVTRQPCSTAR